MEARTKIEQEIESHTLQVEIRLSDGTQGKVFTRHQRNEAGVFVYSCNVCGVNSLSGETCLQTHIIGRKHQMKMSQKTHDATQFRANLKATNKQHVNKIVMDIAPGEPLPPGLENEVRPVPEIQKTLDKFKTTPLVALEYIMELRLDSSWIGEPSYHCILCDKRGDPRTILNHLTSNIHRMKFLEKHFPSIIREIGPLRFNKKALKAHLIQDIIEKVCKSIEDYHGRLTVGVHKSSVYNIRQNQAKIQQEVIFDKHFDERTGPNFLDAIDKKAIENFLANENTIDDGQQKSLTAEKKSLLPSNIETVKEDEKIIEIDDIESISSGSIGARSRSRSPSSKRKRATRRRQSRSPSIHGDRRKGPAHRIRLNHIETMLNENNSFDSSKTAKCRKEIDKAVDLLAAEFRDFQKNPEKHPEYNNEWKKFWNRRYKELQAEKRDPSKHDFKPEWVEYWTKRMKELYDDEIDAKVKEIKNKYASPNRSPVITVRRSRSRSFSSLSRSSSPVSKRSNNRNKVSRSPAYRSRRSKSKSRSRRSRSRSRSRSRRTTPKRRQRSRSRSFSPFPANSHRHHESYPMHYPPPHSIYPPQIYPDPYGYYSSTIVHPPSGPAYRKDQSVTVTSSSAEKKVEEEVEDNEPLTLISVCRLLTALEDYLGSLGPKCIDLLSKALALEKIKANSSDQLLTDECCVFFETVKEKLKGLITANMVSEKKERAVKKAIQKIAALIHTVNKKLDEKKELPGKINPIETKEDEFTGLISRIKSALIVQGKTDTTSAQLDQLLLFFLEIARLNSKSDTIITVKEYLQRSQNNGSKTKQADVKNGGSAVLESLTDSDLQTLLQNFMDLSSEEQHHLINYLKRLELTDPDRVKHLRSFVGGLEDVNNISHQLMPSPTNKSSSSQLIDLDDDRISEENTSKVNALNRHYNNKSANNDININIAKQSNIFDSEDEDDYTYDDLAKSVRQSETTKETNDVDIIGKALSSKDTQNLIANLMGSLQQSIAAKNTTSIIPGLTSTQSSEKQQVETYKSFGTNNPAYYQQHHSQEGHFEQYNLNYNPSQNNAEPSIFHQNTKPIFPIQTQNPNTLSSIQNQSNIEHKLPQTQYTAYQNLNTQRNSSMQQTQQPNNQQAFYQYYRKQ